MSTTSIGWSWAVILLGLSVVWLAVWVGSLAWVWKDANRRGQPGFIVAVLVGFLFWPLSLIVWAIARPNPPNPAAPAAPRRNSGCVWALVAVGAVGLLVILPILAGIFVPAIAAARERARRTVCMSNERQLALAYIAYANENGGKCPETCDDLRGYGVPDNILHCPSASDPATCSYSLVSGATNATDAIVRENPDNHRSRGSNVAYRDGRVEWVGAQ